MNLYFGSNAITTMATLFGWWLTATTRTTTNFYCHAFVPLIVPQRKAVPNHVGVVLSASKKKKNGNDSDSHDMQDYENARKAFEESISLPGQNEKIPDNVLTTAMERMKEMELEMLYCLQDSDAVIDPLVDLWTRERPNAAQDLVSMEGHCSSGLLQEETTLRKMIEEYETWVEPQSRLAVLLFTKGLYEDAEYWCQQVLHTKPWQFEIGQLLVVIYLRMGYFPEALQVARHYCLPALNENTQNKRRKEWVEAATTAALEELQSARKAAVLAVSNNPIDECSLEAEGVCWE